MAIARRCASKASSMKVCTKDRPARKRIDRFDQPRTVAIDFDLFPTLFSIHPLFSNPSASVQTYRRYGIARHSTLSELCERAVSLRFFDSHYIRFSLHSLRHFDRLPSLLLPSLLSSFLSSFFPSFLLFFSSTSLPPSLPPSLPFLFPSPSLLYHATRMVCRIMGLRENDDFIVRLRINVDRANVYHGSWRKETIERLPITTSVCPLSLIIDSFSNVTRAG